MVEHERDLRAYSEKLVGTDDKLLDVLLKRLELTVVILGTRFRSRMPAYYENASTGSRSCKPGKAG